ncbi:hypothetical protein BV20DRAFT_782111 [Pilatotrama ljubarskyi]|nr:hypothetical protein BV20DRAFT_782111 [Pilatotrama ljubarskyi]
MACGPIITATQATSYVKFVVDTSVACHLYRKMLARYDVCPAQGCTSLRCARAVGRFIGSRLFKRPAAAESQHAEKRCPSPYSFCLRFLRRSQSRGSETGSARDAEGAIDSLPMSTIQSTDSRPSANRKLAQHPSCFANSRSTYAQTALYNSQDS